MANEIFYPPPDPVQLQPRRFVPIPPQGQQPPRRNPASLFAQVLASWPTGLEYQPPRLLPSAATLPQPVVAGVVPFTRLSGSVLSSWLPADPTPQRLTTIAPLTLVYGDQPPRNTGLMADMFAEVLACWPTGYEYQPPRSMPSVATIPPPVVVSYVPFARQPASVLSSWLPGDPIPQPRSAVAPLTLVYGAQPVPSSTAGDMALVLASWPTGLEYQPPRSLPSAATLPQPVVAPGVPFTRLPSSILSSWLPGDPLPQPRATMVAPLTLVYGDQPPRFDVPLPSAGWWADPATPQAPRPVAAVVTVPPLAVSVAHTAYPYGVIQSWQPDPWPAQARGPVAPLSLAYGSQPRPTSTVRMMSSVLASWPTGLEHQPQQRPLTVVPLTLRYGDPPPLTIRALAGLSSVVSTAWLPADPIVQGRPPLFIPILIVTSPRAYLSGVNSRLTTLDGVNTRGGVIVGVNSRLTKLDGIHPQ